MPRGKEDSQANVVCMFEFVNDDTGKRLSLDRRPCRFSGMRFRYTPQRFRDVKEHKHLDFIVWLNSKRTTMKLSYPLCMMMRQ